MTDKIENEAATYVGLCSAITANGYPEALTAHFIDKINEVRKERDELHDTYVAMMSGNQETDFSKVEAVTTSMDKLDKATKSMDANYKKFQKSGAGADIKRMSEKRD